MKNLIALFLFLFTVVAFSQSKKIEYHFDYYTVYEFKNDENDTSKSVKEIYFSNSKDSTMLLFVVLENEAVKRAFLTDYTNNKVAIFKDKLNVTNYTDVRIFNQVATSDISLDYCIKNTKYNYHYEVNYNDSKNNSFSITKYKNSKKKKIVDVFVAETSISKISLFKKYNYGGLFGPLWCKKFTLMNNDIINNSYFLIKGKKKYLRKLLEINTTDFTINIDTTNNLQ